MCLEYKLTANIAVCMRERELDPASTASRWQEYPQSAVIDSGATENLIEDFSS